MDKRKIKIETTPNLSMIFMTCLELLNTFEILEKIDKGDSANIFKIKNKSTGKCFALKAYNHKHIKGIEN